MSVIYFFFFPSFFQNSLFPYLSFHERHFLSFLCTIHFYLFFCFFFFSKLIISLNQRLSLHFFFQFFEEINHYRHDLHDDKGNNDFFISKKLFNLCFSTFDPNFIKHNRLLTLDYINYFII